MGRATRLDNGHIEVRLSVDEQHEASKAAKKRYRLQRKHGRLDGKARACDDGSVLDRYGAIGEQAVAVAFGVPWTGKFKPMDEWEIWRRVGHDVSGMEVKSTRHHDGCLILQRNSAPSLPAVLAIIGTKPLVTLVGWCFTYEGQKEEYWQTDIPRPCYMIPQNDLKPMTYLYWRLGVEPPAKEPEITGEELEDVINRSLGR